MANLPSSVVDDRENNIQNFIELSGEEKRLVLERASTILKATITREPTPYDDLNERVLHLLEKGASQSFFTDNLSITKTNITLNNISDGIVSLLHQWPNQKYKLHAFFNYSLPQPIRFVIWYLHLSNASYRQKFLNDMVNHPQSVLSPMDTEIQRHCDSLIATFSLASSMIKPKENLNVMKAILSYHRSLFTNRHDLTDSEYYYAIPIILSHSPPLSTSEGTYEKSLSILIEMYRTFLDTMPAVLRDGYLKTSTLELEPWFRKIEFYLKKLDQPVYNHLQTILRLSHTHLSTTEDTYVLVLLRKCCYTWFKYMFFGCLATDPLLFVWDQYIITSDIPTFHDEFLPTIAAAIIIALRDSLVECKRTSEIELILQHKTNIITIDQLQLVIVRFFLPDLKHMITNLDSVQAIRSTDNQRSASDSQTVNQSEQRLNRSGIKTSPIHDLLRTIRQTLNRVAHGEGENSAILNEQTKNSIRVYKLDKRMAEREVTGRRLLLDELNALSDKQKEMYNKQRLKALNKRIQHRYIAERKNLLDKN